MRRRLDAAELADAALCAAVVLALLTVGRLLAAGTFFQVIGTIVMATLAARRRLRVVATSTAAAMAMALLLGGIGPITQAFVAGLFGWTGGFALRRRLGLVKHVGVSVLIAWPIVSAVTVGFLWVFSETRDLSLENGRNQWEGMARLIRNVGLEGVADRGTTFVNWSIENWWVMVPVLQLGVTIGYSLIVRRVGRAVLERVDRTMGPPWVPPTSSAEVPAPLPIRLGPTVSVSRRASETAVDIDATVETGESIVLLGDNGAGKTTTMEAIAGLHLADGVDRPGPVGLGRPGGVALVAQAPHTQVLGLRVVDDLRWGLDAIDDNDVHRILASVGLAGREQQPTAQLSGGELQRLAIAATLARTPSLLLSDESTAMLDAEGRRQVLGLLDVAHHNGATVLHSTHLSDELARFSRAITLGTPTVGESRWTSSPALFRKTVIEARSVGYVHDAGSPWESRALRGVDLEVERGELAVVTGANGSGKTTLMRLLAGLIPPTEGSILLEGDPLRGPSRDIGLVFQHAPLQLLRPTVLAEVRSLAGTNDHDVISAAMTAVGFDPDVDGGRRVAELSGGQQRRVLLAGLAGRQCKVAILDEPLAGLDRAGRELLTTLIDQLLAAGTAVIVVSHDPGWARERADRIVSLDAVARSGS